MLARTGRARGPQVAGGAHGIFLLALGALHALVGTADLCIERIHIAFDEDHQLFALARGQG